MTAGWRGCKANAHDGQRKSDARHKDNRVIDLGHSTLTQLG